MEFVAELGWDVDDLACGGASFFAAAWGACVGVPRFGAEVGLEEFGGDFDHGRTREAVDRGGEGDAHVFDVLVAGGAIFAAECEAGEAFERAEVDFAKCLAFDAEVGAWFVGVANEEAFIDPHEDAVVADGPVDFLTRWQSENLKQAIDGFEGDDVAELGWFGVEGAELEAELGEFFGGEPGE